MKYLKCRNCGKTFEVDPDNPDFKWGKIAAGAAAGAAVGSFLPVIGTVFGAMVGAKGVADGQRGSFKCPRCGKTTGS